MISSHSQGKPASEPAREWPRDRNCTVPTLVTPTRAFPLVSLTLTLTLTLGDHKVYMREIEEIRARRPCHMDKLPPLRRYPPKGRSTASHVELINNMRTLNATKECVRDALATFKAIHRLADRGRG